MVVDYRFDPRWRRSEVFVMSRNTCDAWPLLMSNTVSSSQSILLPTKSGGEKTTNPHTPLILVLFKIYFKVHVMLWKFLWSRTHANQIVARHYLTLNLDWKKLSSEEAHVWWMCSSPSSSLVPAYNDKVVVRVVVRHSTTIHSFSANEVSCFVIDILWWIFCGRMNFKWLHWMPWFRNCICVSTSLNR